MLKEEDKAAIVKYRIDRAFTALDEAKEVAQLKRWTLVANRLYYSVFYMASALLVKNDIVTKSHSGTMHLFGEQFVKSGKVDKTYGQLYTKLFQMRQSGDYDDMFDIKEEAIVPYIERVDVFLHTIAKLIS